MEQITETDNNEEITLLDLFAVLIKFRKLIIIGTLVTIIIVFGLFFIKNKREKPVYEANYIYTRQQTSGRVSLVSSINSNVINNLQNIQTLTDINKKTELFAIPGELKDDEVKYQSFFMNSYFEKDIEIKITDNFYTIFIKSTDIDKSNEFVDLLVSFVNNQISNDWMPLINKNINDLNTIIDMNQNLANNKTLNDVASYNNYFLQLKDFEDLQSKISNYVLYSKKEIKIIDKSLFLTLVIICFASLFIFIFIAFLCNAIQNVKKDEKALNIITDAWKEGK